MAGCSNIAGEWARRAVDLFCRAICLLVGVTVDQSDARKVGVAREFRWKHRNRVFGG